MRRIGFWLLCGPLTLALPGASRAVTLEQVILHEHPLFKPREAPLTVGRDGRVYMACWGVSATPYGYVMRLSRDGKDRFGAEVVAAAFNATANKDGALATANPGYGGHKVAVYGPSYQFRGGVDDFEHDYRPAHVEAGAGGGFFGPDPGPSGRGRPPRRVVQGDGL